jgi:hypothetical protein
MQQRPGNELSMTRSHGRNNQSSAATKARYRAVVREFEHAERVMEKERRVEVLRALLEMYQQQHQPDGEYVKGLRQRLKRARTQLENMRP